MDINDLLSKAYTDLRQAANSLVSVIDVTDDINKKQLLRDEVNKIATSMHNIQKIYNN